MSAADTYQDDVPEASGRRRAKISATSVPPAALRALMVADGRRHLLYGLPYLLSYCACAALILASDHLAVDIATGVVMGHQLYLLFILHHDCVHYTACRNRARNVWLGRFYALFLVKTFTATLETHKRHHAFLGEPDRDPDDHFFAGGIRWVWLRYWQNFSWHTYLALRHYGAKVRRTVIVEQLANLGFWAAVHVALYQVGMLREALFLFWIPAATIILVVGPVTRAYEHLPLAHYAPGDPRRYDIAHNTVTVTSRLLGWVWANITYHVEHHSYPRVPFYRLRRLHLLLRAGAEPAYLQAPYTLYGVLRGPAGLDALAARGLTPGR